MRNKKVKNDGINKNALLWTTIGIALFMFLPIMIAFSYQILMNLNGVTIHEGNSAVFSLFWYSFITVPIGLIAYLILGLIHLSNEHEKRKYRKES